MIPTTHFADTVPDFRRRLAALALIAACGVLGFFGVVRSPFHYDDTIAIVENPYIKRLADFQKNVGVGNIFNRSILMFTFTVNKELGGVDVFGYHLVNIFLHIGAGILLYYLATEWLRLDPPAAHGNRLPLLVAVIHMLNPLAVEPVAYLSSRSELLAAVFYLLAFYGFARFAAGIEAGAAAWRQTLRVTGGLAAFALGCGVKETILTLPLLLLIYAAWRVRREHLEKILPVAGTLLLALLGYLIFRYRALHTVFSAPADPDAGSDHVLYLLTQIKVIMSYYLVKAVFPLGLNFEPDVRMLETAADPSWILALGGMITLGTMIYFRESRALKFAFLWAFIALLPTSSFIPLKQMASEHRMYLPVMGVALAMAIAFLSPARGAAARAVLAVFLAALALAALHRGRDYRSHVVLWKDTAAKSPRRIDVRNRLANAYIEAKQYPKAQQELAAILRIDPMYSYAHANLGNIHLQREEWAAAQAEFEQALRYGGPSHGNYFSAGLACERQKKFQEAAVYLENAVRMKPGEAAYRFALGEAYRELKMYDAALAEYRAALSSKPDYADAHNNMALIFWQLKSLDLAAAELRQAAALAGDNADTRLNLASVYLAMGKYREAVPQLERVLALRPGYGKAVSLLTYARSRAGGGT